MLIPICARWLYELGAGDSTNFRRSLPSDEDNLFIRRQAKGKEILFFFCTCWINQNCDGRQVNQLDSGQDIRSALGFAETINREWSARLTPAETHVMEPTWLLPRSWWINRLCFWSTISGNDLQLDAKLATKNNRLMDSVDHIHLEERSNAEGT